MCNLRYSAETLFQVEDYLGFYSKCKDCQSFCAMWQPKCMQVSIELNAHLHENCSSNKLIKKINFRDI